MSNLAAWATSFKQEMMCGIHAFGTAVVRAATTPDNFKVALYLTSASIGAGTTTYSATGEASGAGYNPGGIACPNATQPTASGTGAYWNPSGSWVFGPGMTIGTVDCALLYNSTQGNKAIGSFTFTPTAVVAGTLTLTMPAAALATALLQIP